MNDRGGVAGEPRNGEPLAFQDEYGLVDDVRMRWRVSSVTPRSDVPVVLVHGVGVSSRYLVPTLRALAPEHRCFAPDLPGFGRSPVKRTRTLAELAGALSRWLELAGIGPAVFLGNSMGAQFLAHLALADPERVRALVMVGPTMDPAHRSVMGQLLAGLRTAPFERCALFPILVRDYLACGARRILATLREGLASPLEALAPRIEAPVLLVRGEHDRIASEAWLRLLASRFPRAELATVPGAAHAVNFSRPAELAALVRSFLGVQRLGTELRDAGPESTFTGCWPFDSAPLRSG